MRTSSARRLCRQSLIGVLRGTATACQADVDTECFVLVDSIGMAL